MMKCSTDTALALGSLAPLIQTLHEHIYSPPPPPTKDYRTHLCRGIKKFAEQRRSGPYVWTTAYGPLRMDHCTSYVHVRRKAQVQVEF